MKIKFETKARTLSFLHTQNLIFNVPNVYFFTVNNWKINKNKICEYIIKNFNSLVVVRSSALNEDTLEKSAAGSYQSYLNIKNEKKNIIKNVNNVIKSYIKKKNYSSKNEILVQNMVKNVWTSGVIFTKNIKNSSPYFIINYDDKSGKTDKVTSGSDEYANKVLKILRGKENKLLSPRFQKLIKGTKQLEKIFNNENLDIEFVIDKNLNIFLLQVRPIVKVIKFHDANTFFKKVNNVSKFIEKNITNKNNIKNIYGQMPDWNPAEMIGKYPKELSISLYSNLITDKSWYVARKQMGYNQFKDNKLMISLAGQPYIDAKKSFYSLLPNGILERLKKKLVTISLQKLKKFPELHDKIEFDCSVSCQTLNTKKLINKVYLNKLTKREVENFHKHLKELTINNLNIEKKSIFEKSIKNVEKLKDYQKEKSNFNFYNLRKYIFFVKKNGIVPFSIFARNAFISKIILKSLVDTKIFSKNDESKFLFSIESIVTDLIKDSSKLATKKIKLSKFKKKYGHLRPGSYDIESKSYKYMDENFFTSFTKKDKNTHYEKFKLTKSHKKRYQNIIIKENFKFEDLEKLLNFIRKSIFWREYSKFIFTKSIDQIFLTLKTFARKNKLLVSQLAFVDINYYLNLKSEILNKKEKDKFLKKIEVKKNEHKINNLIELPILIKSNTDGYIVPSQISRPNFISNKKVLGKKFFLNNKTQNLNNGQLNNKIVMIEGADPGYDWIFLHNILGLITKFGGANSHMSIRCSELDISAAIGCGNEKFDELIKFENIEIDPLSNSLNGIF